MKMNDEKKLREVLSQIYDRRASESRISPAWLATEAMRELDPGQASPSLVYIAANLQLRQIARGMCRNRFEADEEQTDQHSLWPNLQTRYPAVHSKDSEPEYVLLEDLTKADVEYNVQRLRAEAEAKLAHADALEAWWQQSRAAA